MAMKPVLNQHLVYIIHRMYFVEPKCQLIIITNAYIPITSYHFKGFFPEHYRRIYKDIPEKQFYTYFSTLRGHNIIIACLLSVSINHFCMPACHGQTWIFYQMSIL